MSLSNELQRWAEYGNLSPKGKAQVLVYSDKAKRMEMAVGTALKSPIGEPMSAITRRLLGDAIRNKDPKNET